MARAPPELVQLRQRQLSKSTLEHWEQVWQRLESTGSSLSAQGREYLDLAGRLLEVNRALMDIPELENEAFDEVQSIAVLLPAAGAPEDRHLLELIDLITHLLDLLYVQIEYAKWEVSPLSQLPAALTLIGQGPDLSNSDRELLAFLAAYDSGVRTGRGLADARIRAELLNRARLLSPQAREEAQRPLRAMLAQIEALLEYYEDHSQPDP